MNKPVINIRMRDQNHFRDCNECMRRLENLEVLVAALAADKTAAKFEIDIRVAEWFEEVLGRAAHDGMIGGSRET